MLQIWSKYIKFYFEKVKKVLFEARKLPGILCIPAIGRCQDSTTFMGEVGYVYRSFKVVRLECRRKHHFY